MLHRVQSVAQKGPEHWLNLGRACAIEWGQRLSRAWSPEAVNERAFLAQLPGGAADRASVARHFRERAQPVLGANPKEVMPRVAAASRTHTLAEAEAVCRGEFTFRGQPTVTFRDEVDWFHQPGGNVDWRWELNRHAYFVALGRAFAYTGEARYVATFRRLLCDWLDRNPPLVNAPNWASVLEVAYRANVWAWALAHFRAVLEDEALIACVRGLWLHGRFLAANLEYASPNNHLWLESKALAMLGLLFPEFRGAAAWYATGLRVLVRETTRQVSADGVHLEQSMLYHRILTSELAELLIVMEDNAVATPAELRDALARMLRFETAMLKPDGEPPLFGDSALTDSYLRFDARLAGAAILQQPDLADGDLDEATLWLIGPGRADWLQRVAAPRAEAPSRAFIEGGYCVMRSSNRYLIFDCGPFGYRLAPGHGHADALSFELFADGQTWLVDPGVYSYHLGADWRRFFRSTAAHNTLTVDGQDQTELLDDWRVRRQARTRLHHWLSDAQLDFADAEHDGYARLSPPVTHRRQIVFVKPDYWLVFDRLTGAGRHRVDWHFHFAAEIVVALEPGIARCSRPDGSRLSLAFAGPPGVEATTLTGSLTPIQGWVSRHSGEKSPAPVLRLSITAALPLEFVVAIVPHSTAKLPIRIARSPVLTGAQTELDSAQAVAVRLVTEAWADEVIVDRRPVPELKRLGDWERQARVAVVRREATGAIARRWVEEPVLTAVEGASHV